MKKHLTPAIAPLILALTASVATVASGQTQQTTPLNASAMTRPRTVTPVAPATNSTAQQTTVSRPTPTTSSQSLPEKLPQPASKAPLAAPIVPKSPALPPSVTPLPAPQMSVEKLRSRLTEAQRLFKTKPVLTASSPQSSDLVTIAALDHDSSQIHLIRLTKGSLLKKDTELTLSTSLGKTVRLRVVRPNFVNSAVSIYDIATNKSFAPLMIEYPIEKGGYFREMAYYTSAHPALLTRDLIKSGQNYVHTMLDLAAKRLALKGVQIAPDLIDIAERLCVVEHVDHDRFRKEDRLALYEEIFALYALNELDTYKYSVSVAGAGGMVQMIPATYQSIRQTHPGVGLNPDFVLGMRNHGNALEAMLVYINDTWSGLGVDPEVNYALSTGLATKAELIAAGYNSNPTRLPYYLARGGADWRNLVPRETQMYLQIYSSLNSLIPMKTRAKTLPANGVKTQIAEEVKEGGPKS